MSQSSLLSRRALVRGIAPALTAAHTPAQSASLPWYRRAYRWGQTNITEKDPQRYDIDWWRRFWKRTETQAVIINAGGIVAYYPSKFPLHYRAQFLKGRDLFGELTEAAHKDGLFVMARLDSNRTPKISSENIPIGSRATATATRIAPPTSTSTAPIANASSAPRSRWPCRFRPTGTTPPIASGFSGATHGVWKCGS
jgi:hypothetical protein